jgi:hypothetical protein
MWVGIESLSRTGHKALVCGSKVSRWSCELLAMIGWLQILKVELHSFYLDGKGSAFTGSIGHYQISCRTLVFVQNIIVKKTVLTSLD